MQYADVWANRRVTEWKCQALILRAVEIGGSWEDSLWAMTIREGSVSVCLRKDLRRGRKQNADRSGGSITLSFGQVYHGEKGLCRVAQRCG